MRRRWVNTRPSCGRQGTISGEQRKRSWKQSLLIQQTHFTLPTTHISFGTPVVTRRVSLSTLHHNRTQPKKKKKKSDNNCPSVQCVFFKYNSCHVATFCSVKQTRLLFIYIRTYFKSLKFFFFEKCTWTIPWCHGLVLLREQTMRLSVSHLLLHRVRKDRLFSRWKFIICVPVLWQWYSYKCMLV